MNNIVTLKLSKPLSNRRKLNKLCEWIDMNIHQPISWDQLVTHGGMDHVELQRQFTVHLKTTPMQWIRMRRVEAKQITVTEKLAIQKLPASLMTKAQ